MSLSSNTAQTRELSELRNHLKWLDEERRKSGRKMAELEQRLAQQGREVAERDQKIQELEWHVANFSERFERMPDLDTNVAGVEQRLQDLEWHLSNMNTQLTRLPNMEEERTRLLEEVTRAVSQSQEQVEASQSILESRLRTEIMAYRETDERQSLAARQEEQGLITRQEEQAQAINQMDQQFAALQESVGILSAQLRERTVTLAAESQANISSLAARLQEHLDAMAADQQARLDAFAFESHNRLEEVSTENQSRQELFAADWQKQLELLSADWQTRQELLAADWQSRLDALPAASTDVSPELLRLDEQLSELTRTQMAWDTRWTQVEQQVSELNESLATQMGWDTRWAQVEQQVSELNESLAPVKSQQMELALLVERLPEVESRVTTVREEANATTAQLALQLAHMDEQLEGLAQTQTRWVELEQQVGVMSESLTPIRSLQTDLAVLAGRLPEVENRVTTVREEASATTAQLAQQVAHMEESIAKLGHIREIMPLLDRLEQELELRQAEEVRLSNLIGTQENRFAPLAATLEEVTESTSALLSRLSESERVLEEVRASVQDINDNWKPAMSEANRRITPLAEKVTVLSNTIMRAEAGLQSVTGDQSELREMVVSLTDDMRRNQSDVVRQLEGWQVTLDENKDTIERFTQQWITLSNQYKEARMAVQNFAHWQKQLEQQKREASEMLRVETNRMQSRWDGFLLEIQEKLKNFELDLNQKWQSFEFENEQKWSGARRSEQLWREELGAVDELIQKLQQDNRNLIWRVQTAQADAIKKWPRLLMEEVEKAVELNPNRRLSSAATSPRADMSVVDAIEQGLITIDYSDDSPIDL